MIEVAFTVPLSWSQLAWCYFAAIVVTGIMFVSFIAYVGGVHDHPENWDSDQKVAFWVISLVWPLTWTVVIFGLTGYAIFNAPKLLVSLVKNTYYLLGGKSEAK